VGDAPPVLRLNFANIIALRLMLGVGVAFKIHDMVAMASRKGLAPPFEIDGGRGFSVP
jgi:hypothetical protein